eukprot:2239522-Amphidinium_carterae.1
MGVGGPETRSAAQGVAMLSSCMLIDTSLTCVTLLSVLAVRVDCPVTFVALASRIFLSESPRDDVLVATSWASVGAAMFSRLTAASSVKMLSSAAKSVCVVAVESPLFRCRKSVNARLCVVQTRPRGVYGMAGVLSVRRTRGCRSKHERAQGFHPVLLLELGSTVDGTSPDHDVLAPELCFRGVISIHKRLDVRPYQTQLSRRATSKAQVTRDTPCDQRLSVRTKCGVKLLHASSSCTVRNGGLRDCPSSRRHGRAATQHISAVSCVHGQDDLPSASAALRCHSAVVQILLSDYSDAPGTWPLCCGRALFCSYKLTHFECTALCNVVQLDSQDLAIGNT